AVPSSTRMPVVAPVIVVPLRDRLTLPAGRSGPDWVLRTRTPTVPPVIETFCTLAAELAPPAKNGSTPSWLMPTTLFATDPPETVIGTLVELLHRLMPRANCPPVAPTMLFVTLTVEPPATDQTLMPQVKSLAPVTPVAACTVLPVTLS